MIGIYGIFRKDAKEGYIGKSIKIESRFKEHKRATHNERLRRNFNKYGISDFDFVVIEQCSESNLNNREIYWIDKYSKDGFDLYNATAGGDGGDTITMLSEERYAEFISNRSHPRPEHSRYMKQLYQNGKPGTMTGKQHTPEAIDKIRKYSLEHNSFRGMHHTATTKSILSEKASKRIWINNGQIEKAVYDNELDNYIDQGFRRGRIFRPRSHKRKSQGATTIESISAN